jgi:hypothetical protein
VLDSLLATAAAEAGVEVAMTSKDTIAPSKDKTLKALTPDELAAALREAVSFLAKGYVISVNGQEVVALASEEEARGVVSDLRAVYI